MAFKPGVSGNPAGRPKKLLKRIDEVLHEAGVEPIAEVLRLLKALQRKRGKDAPAARQQELRIWMELLPYVYARPKDEGGGDPPEPPRPGVRSLSNDELLRLVRKPTEQKG